MITPLLEKLILQGKARFKNWSYGSGQLGCIPVVTGQTAIIVDFTVEPFIIQNSEKPLREGVQKNLQLLRLESQKTVNDFVMKWNLTEGEGGQAVAGFFPKRYDCFIIATDPIFIRIAVFPHESTWARVPNAPLQNANEPAAPLGYEAANVTNWLDFGAQGSHKPLTSTKNFAASGAQTRDELNINFNFVTNPAFTVPALCSELPVINFSVIYIDENLSNILMSSK